jgi:hypothetical protein
VVEAVRPAFLQQQLRGGGGMAARDIQDLGPDLGRGHGQLDAVARGLTQQVARDVGSTRAHVEHRQRRRRRTSGRGRQSAPGQIGAAQQPVDTGQVAQVARQNGVIERPIQELVSVGQPFH